MADDALLDEIEECFEFTTFVYNIGAPWKSSFMSLPAINTALVYMHRFYEIAPMKRIPKIHAAAAAFHFASKVHDQRYYWRIIMSNIYTFLRHPEPPVDSNRYLSALDNIGKVEKLLVPILGVQIVEAKNPLFDIVLTTAQMNCPKEIADTAFFVCSCMYCLTKLPLNYSVKAIVVACIYYAASYYNAKLSRNPWNMPNVQDVDMNEVHAIAVGYRRMLQRCDDGTKLALERLLVKSTNQVGQEQEQQPQTRAPEIAYAPINALQPVPPNQQGAVYNQPGTMVTSFSAGPQPQHPMPRFPYEQQAQLPADYQLHHQQQFAAMPSQNPMAVQSAQYCGVQAPLQYQQSATQLPQYNVAGHGAFSTPVEATQGVRNFVMPRLGESPTRAAAGGQQPSPPWGNVEHLSADLRNMSFAQANQLQRPQVLSTVPVPDGVGGAQPQLQLVQTQPQIRPTRPIHALQNQWNISYQPNQADLSWGVNGTAPPPQFPQPQQGPTSTYLLVQRRITTRTTYFPYQRPKPQ